jgi:hypothetical protein
MSTTWNEWLRRLRHDLVKRLLWPARDRREMGGTPRPGELVASLIDDEGNPASAKAIWAGLRADAPAPEHPALARFANALEDALAAAGRGDIDAVLALEGAFDHLAQDLAKERG